MLRELVETAANVAAGHQNKKDDALSLLKEEDSLEVKPPSRTPSEIAREEADAAALERKRESLKKQMEIRGAAASADALDKFQQSIDARGESEA